MEIAESHDRIVGDGIAGGEMTGDRIEDDGTAGGEMTGDRIEDGEIANDKHEMRRFE